MSTSDLAIQLTDWAMRLEQARADAASRNIATANLTGSHAVRVDFASRLQALRQAVNHRGSEPAAAASLLQAPFTYAQVTDAARPSLDEQVAELSESEVRYKALAEGMSRQLAILSLAASGRQ